MEARAVTTTALNYTLIQFIKVGLCYIISPQMPSPYIGFIESITSDYQAMRNITPS